MRLTETIKHTVAARPQGGGRGGAPEKMRIDEKAREGGIWRLLEKMRIDEKVVGRSGDFFDELIYARSLRDRPKTT